mmetsp:Transcript_25285/g.58940  ORF Transcript_25285/g.58940 Transcript_25285/m.58940 type:complete len:219 (-) Transcript_25285:630-1286(-)
MPGSATRCTAKALSQVFSPPATVARSPKARLRPTEAKREFTDGADSSEKTSRETAKKCDSSLHSSSRAAAASITTAAADNVAAPTKVGAPAAMVARQEPRTFRCGGSCCCSAVRSRSKCTKTSCRTTSSQRNWKSLSKANTCSNCSAEVSASMAVGLEPWERTTMSRCWSCSCSKLSGTEGFSRAATPKIQRTTPRPSSAKRCNHTDAASVLPRRTRR